MNANCDYVFDGGSIAVDFFFLVSGAMMAASAARKPKSDLSLGEDTYQFMKRKILGFCPNVYLGWLIGFIVLHIGEVKVSVIIQDAVESIYELLFLNHSGLLGFRANGVTWYLSAMLLAMLIIYPILRKNDKNFYYIIAPIIFIFLMGITYQNYKNLRLPSAWLGYTFKGVIRAIMEITGGTLAYKVSEGLKKQEYTKIGRISLLIVEWAMYIIVLGVAYSIGGTKYDWTWVMFLWLGITITLSGKSYGSEFFNNKVVYWLGAYSFSLYLGHGYWSKALKKWFPKEWDYEQRLIVYLIIAIITGLFIMYMSDWLKKWWRTSGHRVKRIFIKEA